MTSAWAVVSLWIGKVLVPLLASFVIPLVCVGSGGGVASD